MALGSLGSKISIAWKQAVWYLDSQFGHWGGYPVSSGWWAYYINKKLDYYCG